MNFLDDTPRLELFRLAGIPVRVDITFALVPLFLFGILQQAPFAIAGPAFAAIIAGVFLSILLHEIGHATVARLLGVRVGEILVGGFYGYARMLDAPRSTAANVAILFAGPLANGLLFLGFWSLLGYPEISARGYFSQIEPSQWIADRVWLLRAALTLTLVNLAMLIFNLLPAYPLDGGHTLDAWIGALAGSIWATRIVGVLGLLVAAYIAYISLPLNLWMLLLAFLIGQTNWEALQSVGGFPGGRRR